MEALVIYPQTKEQMAAIKALMKAMKVTFEQKKGVYSDYVIKGIQRSIKQADEGKLKPYIGIRNMLKA